MGSTLQFVKGALLKWNRVCFNALLIYSSLCHLAFNLRGFLAFMQVSA